MYTDTSAAIYQNGVYHTMGPKTFWYQFYHRSSAALGFLVIALIIAIVRAQGIADQEIEQYLRIGSIFSSFAALVLGALAFVVAKIVHRNNTFALTDDALKIRRGVFHKEEFAIPYRQVQNVEIERTLVQRFLGLSSLIILTAAQEHEVTKRDAPESIIPAVDKGIAAHLQDELLKRSNTQRVSQVGPQGQPKTGQIAQ